MFYNSSTMDAAPQAPRKALVACQLDDDPSSEWITRRDAITRLAAVVGTAALGEGLGEVSSMQVTRHRVPVRGLTAPIRAVQISDLHRSWCVSQQFVAQAVDMAMAQMPALILLTGDFVTRSSRYMPSCTQELSRLHAPLGIYAVLGNHDYVCDDHTGAPVIQRHLRDIGVPVLTNTSTRLQNGLWLVGADDSREGWPDDVAAFEKVPANAPVIAMTHNPTYFRKMRDHACLTITGHTHGRQINIPGLTQLIIHSGTPWIAGWYRSGLSPGRLYVCRGLGVIGIPLRINAPPEIAVFDLTPA
ncbi:MAG: metallophosphoesterase [Armatimonadetes bacterium]|nr:metallophosphoesterase [Armatimonadota bacterium]MDE2207149.1 metallophosphoesterase [Armatimonadota bacterium]